MYDQCVLCALLKVCTQEITDYWEEEECPFFSEFVAKDNKEE